MCPFQDKCSGLDKAEQVLNGILLLACWMSQGNYLQYYKLGTRNVDLHFNCLKYFFLLMFLMNTKGLSDLKLLPANFSLNGSTVINGME